MLAAAPVLVLALAGAGQKVPVEVARSVEVFREQRFYSHVCFRAACHGWPNSPRRTLLEHRFASTRALLDELEWLDRQSLLGYETGGYREDLYELIGRVQDPAAIPWLLCRTTGTGRAEVYDVWLPTWQRGVWGPSFDELSWLENEIAWSGVMRALATHADRPDWRNLAFDVLQQWFHDEATVRFFEAAREDSDTTPEQRLTIEYFFERNGLPVDGARVAAVIDELRRTEDGRKRLWLTSRRMCHEAFVPWLMSMLEPRERKEFNPLFALRDITLRSDLDSPTQWRAWWKAHGSRGREAWVDSAMTRLFWSYESGQRTGVYFPGADVDALRGLSAADHLDDLSRHPAYQDDVPGIVRSIYRPHLREQLADVLFDLAFDEGVNPEAREAAREVLVEFDYVPGPERTWKDTLPRPFSCP